MAQAIFAKSSTANEAEQTLVVDGEFSIDTILLIANDSQTADLHFKITGRHATNSDFAVLKPGEQLKNISIPVKSIVHKASANGCLWRFLGVNE